MKNLQNILSQVVFLYHALGLRQENIAFHSKVALSRNVLDHQLRKFINVCGFGNTGCTAQVDFLSDFEGVVGILKDQKRTREVTNAPYQEFGILKCLHSFGGVMVAKLHKLDISISKAQLQASLTGEQPPNATLDHSALFHLKKRKILTEEYGEAYRQVVAKSLKNCPDNFDKLSTLESLEVVKEAFSIWAEEIYSINSELHPDKSEYSLVLGLKNDPTGAYPLLSTILEDGVTSAILRNPFDTAWDFNRHYKIENSTETIEWFCNHYNSQLNSARSQILNYREHIGGHYFVHDFESFVSSEKHRNIYLDYMVGKRPKTNAYYHPEVSVKNVDVFKTLKPEFIQLIENTCLQLFMDFKQLIREEGLLLKGVEF